MGLNIELHCFRYEITVICSAVFNVLVAWKLIMKSQHCNFAIQLLSSDQSPRLNFLFPESNDCTLWFSSNYWNKERDSFAHLLLSFGELLLPASTIVFFFIVLSLVNV